MNYAMVMKRRVIGFLKDQDTKPQWPAGYGDNAVTAIPYEVSVDENTGEENVKVGMIYNPETGTFSAYTHPVPIPSQLDRIEVALNAMASGSVSVGSVDAAIIEGVNNV